MGTARHRRFTLLDSMVILVALAVGLALARWPLGLFQPPRLTIRAARGAPTAVAVSASARSQVQNIVGYVTRVFTLAYPSVLSLSVAIVLLACRQPRPPLRRVFRRPGLIACAVAIVVAFLVWMTLIPPTIQVMGRRNSSAWGYNFWLNISRSVGFAVVGTWTALTLGRQWRPEPSWIDRTGRWLGASWIVAVILEAASYWSSL